MLSGGLTPYSDRAAPKPGPLRAFETAQRAIPVSGLRGPVVQAVSAADVQSHGGTQTGLYTAASTRHRFETRFWYRVTDRTPTNDGFLHTEHLASGPYSLEITASDARSNTVGA